MKLQITGRSRNQEDKKKEWRCIKGTSEKSRNESWSVSELEADTRKSQLKMRRAIQTGGEFDDDPENESRVDAAKTSMSLLKLGGSSPTAHGFQTPRRSASPCFNGTSGDVWVSSGNGIQPSSTATTAHNDSASETKPPYSVHNTSWPHDAIHSSSLPRGDLFRPSRFTYVSHVFTGKTS